MLKLISLAACIFYVVVSQTYATLGEKGEAVIARNKPRAAHFDSYTAGGFTTYVFQYSKGFYSIGILNGVVEVESYGVWDDQEFPSQLLASEMNSYGVKWNEIASPLDGNLAFVTEDGEYFMVLGEMKPMGVKKSVTFFTKKWRSGAKDLKIDKVDKDKTI